MAYLPYSEIVKVIDAIANRLREDGEFLPATVWSGESPFKAVTFTNPGSFVLLQCEEPEHPDDWVSIQIAGGGGLGARPDPNLFRHLLLRSNDFIWGGPFASINPNGTVTYGHQLTISSSLVSREDPRDAMLFMMDMVQVIGEAARLLATEVLPQFGGYLLDGSDQKHDAVLLAALLGPIPPDLQDKLR